MANIFFSISKTEKAPRFGIWVFWGYRKSTLRLSHVIKEEPKPEKVGGGLPQFAQNEGK